MTLKKAGQLRGCIGYIEAIKPLAATIEEMAKAAAFATIGSIRCGRRRFRGHRDRNLRPEPPVRRSPIPRRSSSARTGSSCRAARTGAFSCPKCRPNGDGTARRSSPRRAPRRVFRKTPGRKRERRSRRSRRTSFRRESSACANRSPVSPPPRDQRERTGVHEHDAERRAGQPDRREENDPAQHSSGACPEHDPTRKRPPGRPLPRRGTRCGRRSHSTTPSRTPRIPRCRKKGSEPEGIRSRSFEQRRPEHRNPPRGE